MTNTIEADFIPTQGSGLVDSVQNMVSDVKHTLIHVSLIDTLPCYESALSLEDSTAIPNLKWDALLDKIQDENGMIDITTFEARLEVLGEAGMRPPKSSGVGSSNRTELEKKFVAEVMAIFKVYKPQIKAQLVPKTPLLYLRTDKVDDSSTVGSTEEE